MPSSLDKFPMSKLFLLDIKSPNREHFALHNKVYQFWRELWNSTYLELTDSGITKSDEFLGQHEVCVLIAEDQIVGTASLAWYDLRLKSNLDYSYFKHYPNSVIKYFAKENIQKVMSLGQLAVNPEWRKVKFGAFASEILVSAACKRFLESDGDAIVAYTRNNRKINDLAYRHGARCVLSGRKEHNVEVDYVAFLRNEITPTNVAGVPEEIDRLWRQKVHSVDTPTFTEIKPNRRHLKVA